LLFPNNVWRQPDSILKSVEQKMVSHRESTLDPLESTTESGGLKRHLSARHIQLISIGGAIGVGLFMGSGKMVSLAGTSILLIYAIIGFFMFFTMRAMGELLLSNLKYKSFADCIAAYLGPKAGFFTAWSYWLVGVVAVVSECIVVGKYFQYWYPDLPVWIPAFTALGMLFVLNILTVKVFGELEFWFALIKIVAIVGMIVAAIKLIAVAHVSPDGVTASVDHLLNRDSFMPHGIMGFFAGFQLAVTSFAGVELIGTTAAEAKNPTRTLPRAINAVPLRIFLFTDLRSRVSFVLHHWHTSARTRAHSFKCSC
jgi:D-serine/D-alanine/glycine transporter